MSENIKPQVLTPEQEDRLWQRYLSEEEIFNNRLNFFLVIESVILGASITIFGQSKIEPKGELILKLSIFLGLALTGVWAYVSARQKWVLGIVRKRAHKHLPEFKETEEEIGRGRWPFQIRFLLAHMIPAIFFSVWLILLFQL